MTKGQTRWWRNAWYYYVLDFQQSISDAKDHAERLRSDMVREYGTKVKNWPLAREMVREDVSYWS